MQNNQKYKKSVIVDLQWQSVQMPRQVQTKAWLDGGVHRKSVGIFDPTDDTMMSVLAHCMPSTMGTRSIRPQRSLIDMLLQPPVCEDQQDAARLRMDGLHMNRQSWYRDTGWIHHCVIGGIHSNAHIKTWENCLWSKVHLDGHRMYWTLGLEVKWSSVANLNCSNSTFSGSRNIFLSECASAAGEL